MAIKYENGTTEYEGAVVYEYTHYWLDGMSEEYAVVWDMEKHEYKDIMVGYYGSDCRNLVVGIKSVEVEVSTEVARDILRTMKTRAYKMFCESVIAHKNEITKDIEAVVVRGRKVPKGTKVKVFWVGEKPTYRSQCYSWMNETEKIAGCYDESGKKVWIKADYLKSLAPIKSPRTVERKKYIKDYIERNAKQIVIQAAMGGC